MGQAKIRQYNRTKFLQEHPLCVYCGDVAVTIDHCPPRCFFERRRWPETYEFPACDPCNQGAKREEQVLAVIVRLRLVENENEIRRDELWDLIQGVKNNNPEYIAEWGLGFFSASRQKRALRETFGQDGDALRRAGWGTINIGPLTHAAIKRFGVKLGKALYYRHNSALFEGDIYVRHLAPVGSDKDGQDLKEILRFAPVPVFPERSRKALGDQFMYRFNADSTFGIINAVIEFNPQLIYHVTALSKKLAEELKASTSASLPKEFLHHCTLKPRPEPAHNDQ